MDTRNELARLMASQRLPVTRVSDQPQTPMPIYEIWSRSQGKKVGEATTLQGARRSVDRRDNAYGAYDHYHKKVGGE